METKKGIALNQAFGAVLVLVLVAVLVIVAIFLFVTLGGTFINLATAGATNDTTDMTSGGPVTLDNGTLCNPTRFVITAVVNATDGVAIGAGNYTVSDIGVFNNLTNELPTVWNVSYTANWGGPACEGNQEMITQFATYPALVGLIGTIIFLGLVIGVLVASFVFGGKGV